MEYIKKENLLRENPRELKVSIGSKVTLWGMVYKIRHMSGFDFLLLQTEKGLVQCVCSQGTDGLENLCENAAVEITGSLREEKRSRMGFEVGVGRINVISVPFAEPPLVINGKKLSAGQKTVLDNRAASLRNEAQRAVFAIQSETCFGIRQFLKGRGFTEIHTPKIVSGSAESGAGMFELDYFGKKAFLAQSPQLYKQMMVPVFGRVYEIGPVFRAEKHDTSRHLNEYTGIDLELGFVTDISQLMSLEWEMLSYAIEHVKSACPQWLEVLKTELPLTDTVPSVTFEEGKALIAQERGYASKDKNDFEPDEEKALCRAIKKQTGSDFVFVTRYKGSKRPFYAMDCADDPSLTESFDLLFRGMEITTGGLRIHRYEEQVEKMRRKGLDPADFEGYLTAHKCGMPPHGGMGIGLERLTACLLGFENVREASLFPRDITRFTP